ncbi:MAG TPA: HAD-IB family hydrolase, partial [Myxococcota bacterium]|nr:HAD-IB family hydrolase [Myxococcota bacterium]
VHAERLAEQLGEKLEDSWFYTDSYSDLPVLLRVRHPVVVNPDPALAREARRRGWTQLDWGGSKNP